jgi:hypothetical protein
MLNPNSIEAFILLQSGGGGGIIYWLLVAIMIGSGVIYFRRISSAATVEENVEVTVDPSLPRSVSALMKRYKDAYLYARVITGIGNLVKNVGIGLGLLILIVLFVGGSAVSGVNPLISMFAGIIVGGPVGIFIYIWGILISAGGQLLKASLDCAVNGSPFLTNEHRAQIMSLPTP